MPLVTLHAAIIAASLGGLPPSIDIQYPALKDLGVIASDPHACIRDPTQVIHFNNTYHFWATHNPQCADRKEFPRAQVYHYYTNTSRGLDGTWATSGAAVGFGAPGAWDAWSVFTPGAIFDPDTATWYLWYGAVANGGRPTRESVGLATATSPFGPWTRSKYNPVFQGNNTYWCGDKSARVDEADAYEVQGVKFVLVKGVCTNFTALPTAWVSAKGPASFDPPYSIMPGAGPLVTADQTPEHKGFEQARIYPGPDGLLHLTGHDHVGSSCSHFVSQGGILASDWHQVNTLPSMGLSTNEATPVFDGLPGDKGGVPKYFIQFSNADEKEVHLMAVDWLNQTAV